jgi:hypothetical protein
VSNTNEDFPEPDTPATTVSASRGMSTSMHRRLFVLAPLILIERLSTAVVLMRLTVGGDVVRF